MGFFVGIKLRKKGADKYRLVISIRRLRERKHQEEHDALRRFLIACPKSYTHGFGMTAYFFVLLF